MMLQDTGNVSTRENLTVINISNHTVTEAERSVLELGLSFCPNSNFDYAQTRVDLFLFTRKLK